VNSVPSGSATARRRFLAPLALAQFIFPDPAPSKAEELAALG
jgi:hypothetical protein